MIELRRESNNREIYKMRIMNCLIFYKEILFIKKKKLKAHIQKKKKLFSLIGGIKFTIPMLFKLSRVSMAWKTVILIPFFTKPFITILEKYVKKI